MPVGHGERIDVTPSLKRSLTVDVVATADLVKSDALGIVVGLGADPPADTGLDRTALERAGFSGVFGKSLIVAVSPGPVIVLLGGGSGELSPAELRDTAAAFADAMPQATSLAIEGTRHGRLRYNRTGVCRGRLPGPLLLRRTAPHPSSSCRRPPDAGVHCRANRRDRPGAGRPGRPSSDVTSRTAPPGS